MSIRDESLYVGVGQWPVITLTGEIDLSRIEELDQIFKSGWRRQAPGLIIDCTPVTFMDSTGLGWLLRVESEVVNDGGQLRVVLSQGPARRVFELSGLGHMFELYPSLDAAYSGG